ncbi:MAG: DUF1643 domain-containing protein [Usitatibacter sp.]
MIERRHDALGWQSSALFSDCEQYRYVLRRVWNETKPLVVFLMLNPSTADERVNDPTVERCERRAMKMGYGGYFILNLFAFRATDPRDMKAATDPVGPQNDETILAVVGGRDVICGWGSHGGYRNRAQEVRELIRHRAAMVLHLGLTKGGEPRHPLYIGYDVLPQHLL